MTPEQMEQKIGELTARVDWMEQELMKALAGGDESSLDRFKKPTILEIKAVFMQKGKTADQAEMLANKFHSYYESNGWRVGKTRMQKWKTVVNRWIMNEKTYGTAGEKQQARSNEISELKRISGNVLFGRDS